MNNISETITENLIRDFYKDEKFLEKSAIHKRYGFKSKNRTKNTGYPDFFKEYDDFILVIEAKALKHSDAEEEVCFYMKNNDIAGKDIIGIAISGQNLNQIKSTYYIKFTDNNEILKFNVKDKLLTIDSLSKLHTKKKHGETISDDELTNILKSLNSKLHEDSIVNARDRSLFFSGIMIALTNNNFRSTYRYLSAPSKEELATTQVKILESYSLNESILNAIGTQLSAKVNNMSKHFSWKDKFSFIRNIDYPLIEYKELIEYIENKIYIPFSHEEKQDILGRAYKIFLQRQGKAENKNIILTPDHIKILMIKLARLTQNDVVLDTCMGSGGFLMEAMEIMIGLVGDDIEKIKHIQEHQLIGFENDEVLFALACSNMFLHGDGRSNLLFRSSLLNSDKNGKLVNSNDEELFNYIKKKKATKAIINPPYERTNPIDFTIQAIDYLEDNGKLIIIMPTPTLFKHKENKTIELLDKAKLEFVIKMPYNLFTEQGRTVNTSIFGFTKTPHHIDDNVLFYNMKDDGYESIQHKGRVDVKNMWNDIESQVINAINNLESYDGISEKKKIMKKDKNGDIIINPSGFQEISNNEELYPISKIFKIEEGTLQSTKNEDSGVYDFITASDEWKKHTEYTHDTEALIYAIKAGGSLGKSQYVNGKFIASNLTAIITPRDEFKDKINMRFYNEYFNLIREKIQDDLANGTSKLTISPTDLEDYYIELIDKDKQDIYVENYLKKIDDLRNELQLLKEKSREGIKKIL